MNNKWMSLDKWKGEPPEESNKFLAASGERGASWCLVPVEFLKNQGYTHFMEIELPKARITQK